MDDIPEGERVLAGLTELAARYLDAVDLPVPVAMEALDVITHLIQGWPKWPPYPEKKLPAAERNRANEVARRCAAVAAIAAAEDFNRAQYGATGKRHPVDEEDARLLTEGELATIYRLVDDETETREPRPCSSCGHFVHPALESWPAFVALHAEADDYARRTRLTDDELRAEAQRLLTHAERGVQPSFYDWVDKDAPELLRGRPWPTFRLASALHAAAMRRAGQELERARAELEKERAKPKRPEIRVGTGYLRSTNTREEHVAKARRKVEVAGLELSPEDRENRLAFRFEPLGWAETLVVHGLTHIAWELGLLDTHPSALTAKPLLFDAPTLRVRIPFPGYAELAHIVGFDTDASGRIPKETRQTLERALRNLTTIPRWISQRVLVPVRKGKRLEYVPDERVTNTLWVELEGTLKTKQATLTLHPVAFSAHLASYVAVGNLAARWAAARRAIGRPRMRDEWARADEYFRLLAGVELANGNGRRLITSGDGGEIVTAGDVVLPKEIDDETLRDALVITRLARSRGETAARARVEDALRFAQAMGTIRTFRLLVGKRNQAKWYLELLDPGIQRGEVDPDQVLMLPPPELKLADEAEL